MSNETPIPVLMYHTVGIPDKKWKWQHLTCPYQIFEDQMKWLRKRGFVTITLNDLYEYIFHQREIPELSVILTFDDGYADNWIFAYPIMKRYGMKGNIFVNPEFADKRRIVRKRIDQIESIDELEREDISGFLSWDEMKECENEGVFDIQSHAMSHTWHPVSDRIIDFRHPGDRYIWMTWNDNPDRKPELQYDDPELINYGEPVYEFSKSLESPRYFPNENISRSLIEYVKKNGERAFFERADWKKILLAESEELKKEKKPGRYETDEEYRGRIKNELIDSKRIIEEELDKKIDFLCWPGGSSTETGVEIAREAGYKMTTTGKDLPQPYRENLLNLPSQKSDRIARISPILFWDGRNSKDSRIVYNSGFSLTVKLLQYKRMRLAQYWGKLTLKFLKEFSRVFR